MARGIAAGPGGLWVTEGEGDVLAVAVDGSQTEYHVAGAGNSLTSITSGPDGNLWYLEASAVARITASGAVTRFPVTGTPTGITTGPDGNLWLTGSDGFKSYWVGRMTTSGGFTKTPVPGQMGAITTGSDGNLWSVGQTDPSSPHGVVERITTAGLVTSFLDTWDTRNETLNGIASGPDGALWYTIDGYNRGAAVGRITTAGLITDRAVGGGGAAGRITSGPDGRLWFSGYDQIGAITTAGNVTMYPALDYNPSFVFGIGGLSAGPDGRIWFTHDFQIGAMTTTGAVTLFGIPSGVSSVCSENPSSGSQQGGNQVDVYGSEFSGATAVTFGDSPAPAFRVVSSTRIIATAPAGAGNTTVPVRVVTPAGTGLSGSDYFYVGTATVASLDPPCGTIAGGTSVTINGTNTFNATAVYFGSTSASFTLDGNGALVATAPKHLKASVVDVRVANGGGLSPISAGDRYRYTTSVTKPGCGLP